MKRLLSLFAVTSSLIAADIREEEALFIRRIADFWQEGEYPLARSQMEEFLGQFPESSLSSTFSAALGDLFLREKKFSEALSYYAKVSDPALQEQTWLNRLQCLYELSWYATLADECEAYLKKEGAPYQKEVTSFLATALYQQCLNVRENSARLTRLAERARPHFEFLAQSNPSPQITQGLAYLYCILKEYERAAFLYETLASVDEEMRFQAALVQAEYNKELAARTFGQIAAQEAGEKRGEALYNRLVLLFELDRYEEIVALVGELEKIPAEKRGSAHLLFGKSALALKNYPLAALEFGQALDAPEPLAAAPVGLLEASLQTEDLASFDRALSFLNAGEEEYPKALFFRAQLLKKKGDEKGALQAVESLLATYPTFSYRPPALFEKAHLAAQGGLWDLSRSACLEFLSSFPDHELSSFALRYLASASTHRVALAPQERKKKEELASDFQLLLQRKEGVEPEEARRWTFTLAKNSYELGHYGEALSLLAELSKGGEDQGDIELLSALCLREGEKDLARFCEKGEAALLQNPTFLSRGAIHIALFNAYLARGEAFVQQGADHLFAAFEEGERLEAQNVEWLTDHSLKERSLRGAERAVKLLKTLPESLPKKMDLASALFTLNRYDEAYALLAPEQGRISKEGLLLLGQIRAKRGEVKEALSLFDTLTSSTLKSAPAAAACLEGARLRLALGEEGKAREQLGRLIAQRHLAHEPLHFEAVLEEVALETAPEKRLLLLKQRREEFASQGDLLAKEYHAAKERLPEKGKLYDDYMKFFEAKIFLLDAQKELQAKGKEILLQLRKETKEPLLLSRVSDLLNDEPYAADDP